MANLSNIESMMREILEIFKGNSGAARTEEATPVVDK